MKSAWGPDLCDVAAWNTEQVEGVDIFNFKGIDGCTFEEMLADDVDSAAWSLDRLDVDENEDEDVLED